MVYEETTNTQQTRTQRSRDLTFQENFLQNFATNDDRDQMKGSIHVSKSMYNFNGFVDAIKEDRDLRARGETVKEISVKIIKYGLALIEDPDCVFRYRMDQILELHHLIYDYPVNKYSRARLTDTLYTMDTHQHKKRHFYVGVDAKNYIESYSSILGMDRYTMICLLWYLALSKYDFTKYSRHRQFLNDDVEENLDFLNDIIADRYTVLRSVRQEFSKTFEKNYI